MMRTAVRAVFLMHQLDGAPAGAVEERAMSENDRYETYKAVPAGYNLRDAEQRELDLFGIPPRPDPDSPAERQLYDYWVKLVSPPFHALPAVISRSFLRPFQTQPPANLESSLNWSGALISPRRPKRFILAVAEWIVPTVRHPSPPALFTEADVPKTLIWVGLDGHNGRLPKVSLPQIGTFHTPDAQYEQQHFAWLDWWHHSREKQEISKISNLDIDPGDEIMAGLYVMISGDVSFFIKNQSTGEFRCKLYKRQALPDIEPLGSSAEWVVERPTEPTTGKLYPLADYGSVHFKSCMARAADTPLGPGPVMTLADNGRMIKMREAFADPYRTSYVSCAKQREDKDGTIGVTCSFHEPR